MQADRDRSSRRNEPNGSAESLAGRTLPKMGDRAILVSDEVKKLHERKEQKYAAPAVRLTP